MSGDIDPRWAVSVVFLAARMAVFNVPLLGKTLVAMLVALQDMLDSPEVWPAFEAEFRKLASDQAEPNQQSVFHDERGPIRTGL